MLFLCNLIIFSVLSKTVQHTIAELLQESRSFNKNDVLVHAATSKTIVFSAPKIHSFDRQHPAWKLIREAQKNQKESGVNTLCLAEGYLKINSGEDHLESPIVLTPLRFNIDKVRGELQLEVLEEAAFVNPYVEHLLYTHEIRTEVNLKNVHEVLISAGFTLDLESEKRIGNFHHHRYTVLRELEALLAQDSFSVPLASLLEDGHQKDIPLELPANLLLPADVDHLEVFQQVNATSTVIQGPPGTGKSQVLTNLLTKVLGANKSSLVLSEKRVALEVLVQKLREFGLDRLGFIVTSDNASRDLLHQLEENWHYFEQQTFDISPNLLLSEQYTSQLQFSLDLLNQPDAVGGMSLYDFRDWMQQLPETSKAFKSNPPSITAIIKHDEIIEEIYERKLDAAIAHFKPAAFRNEDFSHLHDTLKHFKTKLNLLSEKFPFKTWEEFRLIIRKAALAQSKENFNRKKYTDLFRKNSRKQKRFLKLYQQWVIANNELDHFESQGADIHWKKKPTRVDLATLKKLRSKSGLFAKQRFHRTWKTYSNDIQNASEQIDYLHNLYEKEDYISQLIVNFCELGIIEPKSEVAILHISIQDHLDTEWEVLDALSNDDLQYLTESHELLGQVRRTLDTLLFLEEDAPIIEILTAILKHFGELVAFLPKLKSMDSSTIQLLGIAETATMYKAIAANSHWSLFRQQFPSFSEFDMMDLYTKSQAIIQAQAQESRQFSQAILAAVKMRFASYQELLSTPVRKLSEAEKERKKRLRKGKSILVKEFAKTRSHPSIRELFASEAREWIQLLVPICFSNPTQVARIFPLDQHLFDIAVFDEASQIPLQHGLGALQRANHAVIAGDSQQMGPTSYFKSGSSEIVDLLHQASFHWKTCSLSHHYRSLHPELMAFSNRHFYKDTLTAYQAYGIEMPIRHHFVADGIFEDRKNLQEAQAIAQAIKEVIQTNDTLGIVAFSEEQLTCIRKSLSEKTSKLLQERMEEGTAFLKSIENVQGDECDHLMISFGYGKDPQGTFAMRFGPMNTENGRRRLNVLLTRARKRLDFFTSVTYADFKLSDNESVDLLRLWFVNLSELGDQHKNIQLPFDADYSVSKNELTLRKPHEHFKQAMELVTFQSVMESRGWELRYQ